MDIHEYRELSLLSVIPKLATRSSGERYNDYVLGTVLERIGCKLLGVWIHNDYVTYNHLGKGIHFMYADIKYALPDGEIVRDCIRARYSGTEQEWVDILETEPEDIVIRYSVDGRDIPYSLTFVEVFLGWKRYSVSGDRLDWDFLKRDEAAYENNQGGENPAYCDYSPDWDYEALIYDAYEGDVEDYWMHRT